MNGWVGGWTPAEKLHVRARFFDLHGLFILLIQGTLLPFGSSNPQWAGPSPLPPCSHLPVQKYNQPSAEAAGDPPRTLIPSDTMYGRPYISTTTPAVHSTVLNFRAKSERPCTYVRAVSPPLVDGWMDEWKDG